MLTTHVTIRANSRPDRARAPLGGGRCASSSVPAVGEPRKV